MLPGVPSLFYGDEQGMQGYEDPLCRRTFDWQKEDSILLEHYRGLGKIRNKYLGEMTGDTFFEYNADGLLVMQRISSSGILRVVANNSGVNKSYRVDKSSKDAFSGKKLSSDTIDVAPYSARIIFTAKK